MRIVTWNAARGQFGRKAPLLEPFNADVAVIQEIARPPSEGSQLLWLGDNPNQGIAVIARPPYQLRALPQQENVPRYVIPVAVDGPVPFVMFAVWTLGEKPTPYVRAAATAVDLYTMTFEAGPVVMIGDFNSNGIWDKDHPMTLNHSALVARLESYGMASAYHATSGEAHGKESQPTFYLYRKQNRPYHLDYCFLPKMWLPQIRQVLVGSFDAWKQHSDHRPLMVELCTEAA